MVRLHLSNMRISENSAELFRTDGDIAEIRTSLQELLTIQHSWPSLYNIEMMLENALDTYIVSFSEVGIFLIYSRLSITLWDLFQTSLHEHAFNHAPGEELFVTVGRRKWAATVFRLTTNTSPISERKKAAWAGCGPDWLFLWIRPENATQQKFQLAFWFLFFTSCLLRQLGCCSVTEHLLPVH